MTRNYVDVPEMTEAELNEFDEMQDGLTVFIHQGKFALDCCTYSFDEAVVYRIVLYAHKDQSADYFNISCEAPEFEDFICTDSYFFSSREKFYVKLAELQQAVSHL